MLAQNGFETYGLEVSQAAVDAATKHIESRTDSAGDDGDDAGAPKPRDLIHFQKGDFFRTDWQKALSSEPSRFDLVYDYTVRAHLSCTSRWTLR